MPTPGLLLPDVSPPSMKGLTLVISEPVEVTAGELSAEFAWLRFLHAPRRERPAGEPCAWGDEVQASWLARRDGQLVPLSFERDRRLLLDREGSPYPGLAEALVGKAAGQTVSFST